MKMWLRIGALLSFMLCFISNGSLMPAYAEPLTPEQQKAVEDAVRAYMQQQNTSGAGAPPPPAGTMSDTETTRLDQLGQPRSQGKKYGSTMEGSGKLIYARPFVASPKAIVGGYYDFEYINKANDGAPSNFDQHRLVPFIYGDVSDRLKFAVELEIEHGGVGSSGNTDLKVEFATADYLITEPINLRAGIILLPLGKFNLLHDSPLRDLSERPIVNQRIIPTTLHQPGVGLYGTFYPSQLSQLNYEIYVTSGFTNAFSGGVGPGSQSNITNTNGLRSARSNSTAFDNNDGKAVAGRLAFSPLLGVEVGGSGFHGAYDPDSNRNITITALDWTLQRGPFELIGEAAWSWIEDNNLTRAGTPINDAQHAEEMWGYYIQLNYHFLPEFLTRLAPTHFRPDVSTFTGVVRWEEVNLGADLPNTEIGRLGERQRLTVGLNFRPTEDSVVKLDVQYSPKERRGNSRIHDYGFVGSVATYF